MGLKPYDRKLSDIFNNKEYAIDFYQREYKWNDIEQEYKPVKSLLDDIFYRFSLDYNADYDLNPQNISKCEWYYLNSYMTNEVDGKRYIVDGQQRLTTLTLLIINLYHMSKERKLDKNIVSFLESSICGAGLYKKVFWMGFVDRRKAIEDAFDNHLNFKYEPVNTSEKNIQENYRNITTILTQRLDTDHRLKFFISYLFDRVFLIEIAIDKQKDVAMVFEVINDRGIPLKAYEILKGKLLGQINKEDIDKYVNIWETNIVDLERFGEENIDVFFSFYFRSQHAESADQFRRLEVDKYHRTIFLDDWDKKIFLKRNENGVKEFIENTLPYYSKVYIDILKYCSDYSPDYRHIYFNGLNDQDRQYYIILSAVELNDPLRDAKIKLVSHLFDRIYTLLNLSGCYKSNTFNEIMIKVGNDIRGKSPSEIKKAFDDFLLEEVRKVKDRADLVDPFRYEFFSPLGYGDFSKTFLRYFFARVEHYIGEKAKLAHSDYYQLVQQARGANVHHIEHILANNDENKKLFAEEEEFNLQRNRLGGLLLLKGPDNQSSNDEPYAEKLKTYSGNGTLFAQTLRTDFYKSNVGFRNITNGEDLHFKPYDVFDKSSIEERHRLLFDIAMKIWLNGNAKMLSADMS